LLGIVFLIRYSITHKGVSRVQSILIIFSPVFVAVCSFITFLRTTPDYNPYDWTPVCFSTFLICYFVAAYKFRFLNIFPGALKRVFESMHESVLVVDSYHFIQHFNNAFIHTFGTWDTLNPVCDFTRYLQERMLDTEENRRIIDCIAGGSREKSVLGELNLVRPVARTFNVSIQKIALAKKRNTSRVISFTDITAYKELIHTLDLKNDELKAANRQLVNHFNTVEELAVANERNRVAREVHDTVGHTLTLLIMLSKSCKIEYEASSDQLSGKLSESIKIAQEGLQELRRTLSSLQASRGTNPDLIVPLEILIGNLKDSGVNIDCTVIGKQPERINPLSLAYKISDALYKAVKEAVTNSLRHGNARLINIILKFEENRIRLFILDNGTGCKTVQEGFGLAGMANRIKELGGSLVYGSGDEEGFNIHIEIPAGTVHD